MLHSSNNYEIKLKRLPFVASCAEPQIPGGTIKLVFAVFSGEDFEEKSSDKGRGVQARGQGRGEPLHGEEPLCQGVAVKADWRYLVWNLESQN